MSDKVFEACKYLTCTTTWKEYGAEKSAGEVAKSSKDRVYICDKGPTSEVATDNLQKKIAGIPQRYLDVTCTSKSETTVREVRGVFKRIEDYLNEQSVEICQSFAVSKTVSVPHAGFDDILADYRDIRATTDSRICADGDTVGQAQAAFDAKVARQCSAKGVECKEEGDATIVLKKSLAQRVGDFFASAGLYFMNDRALSHD